VRERFEREARSLSTHYSALLWAMEHDLNKTRQDLGERVHELRAEIGRECGSLTSAAASWLAGPMMLWTTRRERRRLKEGITYEPQTFIERRNWVEA